MLADSKITGEYFKTITILNGKEFKFDNIVTEKPTNFKDWVKSNEDKLSHLAKHGKSPYFISRNKKIVEGILKPKELSVIEKSNKIKYAKKQSGWFGTDGADVKMPIFTKENTSFEYKNGGKVTTPKSRIENANKSKQETLKFEKELGMAKTFAKNGYNVELLEEIPKISSPDAIINGKKVDFKCLSSANNIVRHAKEAIRKQGADLVYFEFETDKKEKFLSELKVLSSKYKIHGKYYFKGENEIFDF